MIAALLAKLWPVMAGGVVAIIALLTGWARHKQAQTTEAQAAQREAEADAKVARTEQSEAEANATASRAGADAVKERTDVENQIAAGAAGDSAARLRNDWSRD